MTAYDRTLDEEEASDGNLILMAYEEFVQDLAQIFHDVCKSNFLQLELIVSTSFSSMDPDNTTTLFGISGSTPPSSSLDGGFFDRICTGIAADVVGTDKLLQSYVSCLNNRNPLAAILTFHRIWRRNNMLHQVQGRYVH